MTIVVAMLAMMLAAASPAFAHTLAIDEGDDVRSNALARNISGAFGEVDRSRCATATYDSAAAADVSQSQGLTFAQVNPP